MLTSVYSAAAAVCCADEWVDINANAQLSPISRLSSLSSLPVCVTVCVPSRHSLADGWSSALHSQFPVYSQKGRRRPTAAVAKFRCSCSMLMLSYAIQPANRLPIFSYPFSRWILGTSFRAELLTRWRCCPVPHAIYRLRSGSSRPASRCIQRRRGDWSRMISAPLPSQDSVNPVRQIFSVASPASDSEQTQVVGDVYLSGY